MIRQKTGVWVNLHLTNRLSDAQPDVVVSDEVEESPWSHFTTHAQFEAYVKDTGAQLPGVWDELKIAEKKAWLDGQ